MKLAGPTTPHFLERVRLTQSPRRDASDEGRVSSARVEDEGGSRRALEELQHICHVHRGRRDSRKSSGDRGALWGPSLFCDA